MVMRRISPIWIRWGRAQESIPFREGADDDARKTGPRSSAGKAGQRGGWTSKKFKKK